MKCCRCNTTATLLAYVTICDPPDIPFCEEHAMKYAEANVEASRTDDWYPRDPAARLQVYLGDLRPISPDYISTRPV
jgi:hypothetical protein